MNQKAVRIIALVLAILMAGGVLIVAFSNLAYAIDGETYAVEQTVEDAAAVDLAAAPSVPETGTDGPPKVPIIIGAAAVVLAVACVVIPKIAKK